MQTETDEPTFRLPDVLPSGRTGWVFDIDARNAARRNYRDLRRSGMPRRDAAREVVEIAEALRRSGRFPQPYDEPRPSIDECSRCGQNLDTEGTCPAAGDDVPHVNWERIAQAVEKAQAEQAALRSQRPTAEDVLDALAVLDAARVEVRELAPGDAVILSIYEKGSHAGWTRDRVAAVEPDTSHGAEDQYRWLTVRMMGSTPAFSCSPRHTVYRVQQ